VAQEQAGGTLAADAVVKLGAGHGDHGSLLWGAPG
jgi:hypothetical protein